MLFAVSDAVWISVTTVANTLVVGVLALLTMYMKSAIDRNAKTAAVKVEEVKASLQATTAATDKKLDTIVETGGKTHRLVNSAMLENRRLLMIATEGLANKTHDEADVAAAKLAREAYEHQLAEQTKEDAR